MFYSVVAASSNLDSPVGENPPVPDNSIIWDNNQDKFNLFSAQSISLSPTPLQRSVDGNDLFSHRVSIVAANANREKMYVLQHDCKRLFFAPYLPRLCSYLHDT